MKDTILIIAIYLVGVVSGVILATPIIENVEVKTDQLAKRCEYNNGLDRVYVDYHIKCKNGAAFFDKFLARKTD